VCFSLVVPSQSGWRLYWDVITATVLIYTAIVTPYEVAFLSRRGLVFDGVFVCNRITDVVFLVVGFIGLSSADHA
jgi:hypothetical protein